MKLSIIPLMSRLIIVLVGTLLSQNLAAHAAEDRRERVLKDREDIQSGGKWIYNDFARGVAEATRTRKPMLVVFRCIP